jgi:hypothetical protein
MAKKARAKTHKEIVAEAKAAIQAVCDCTTEDSDIIVESLEEIRDHCEGIIDTLNEREKEDDSDEGDIDEEEE